MCCFLQDSSHYSLDVFPLSSCLACPLQASRVVRPLLSTNGAICTFIPYGSRVLLPPQTSYPISCSVGRILGRNSVAKGDQRSSSSVLKAVNSGVEVRKVQAVWEQMNGLQQQQQ